MKTYIVKLQSDAGEMKLCEVKTDDFCAMAASIFQMVSKLEALKNYRKVKFFRMVSL